ncbi:cellulose synthase complex periplasmic endoglucanase BcsZ [Melaminivora sp.]|uniref:cellulose synthase complex periplasmic endoglucanase BcsZ n=1 Tax=Melaminivora sp. TaxID=1933032 RepID=UPI0028ADBBBF|nr:cellulose synthase complex periplasmic endoglucanase BcsZ [Melaminivora sp.]
MFSRPDTPAGGAPRRRRRALAALLAGMLALPAAQAAPGCAAASWPLWERFAQRFMQADGRVIDYSVSQQHSTSEGQSYAMFFALVAHDRARFDKLWSWSVANLAGGDIGARLPAWQWGKKTDGSWGVVDPNPASDANLWFVYALAEAGRLWSEPRYTQAARTLLAQVAEKEVADLPGLGPTLLPAPSGFVLKERIWRLNPSYLPVPLVRALERLDPQGPWKAVAASHARMLAETTPHGFAADWVAWEVPEGGGKGAFVTDPEKGDIGSYDAIRTYLWAGMTPRADPLAPLLRQQLSGMATALQSVPLPPERVRTASGEVEGAAPVGFSAALLPYLQSLGLSSALEAQRQRVRTLLLEAPPETPARYYDQVLGLFGTGYMEQRYQFLPTGRVQLRWEKACPSQKSQNAAATDRH